MPENKKTAQTFEPFHLINISHGNPTKCPNCGAGPEKWEVRNYNLFFHDGDIHCTVCGEFIRMYDAG